MTQLVETLDWQETANGWFCGIQLRGCWSKLLRIILNEDVYPLQMLQEHNGEEWVLIKLLRSNSGRADPLDIAALKNRAEQLYGSGMLVAEWLTEAPLTAGEKTYIP